MLYNALQLSLFISLSEIQTQSSAYILESSDFRQKKVSEIQTLSPAFGHSLYALDKPVRTEGDRSNSRLLWISAFHSIGTNPVFRHML